VEGTFVRYDPQILDQLIAAKLCAVTGNDPDVSPPVASIEASKAAGIKSHDSMGAMGAWELGWEFALRAACAVMEAPIGDGQELAETVEWARATAADNVKSYREERQLVRRAAHRRSQDAA
jgi:hypothetical protein